MHARHAYVLVWFAILGLSACGDRPDPARIGPPNFAAGGLGRPAVLVNPNANDNGTAKTIQEGRPGSGDAVAVEAGAATPAFLPFALSPIAGTTLTSCE